MAWIALVLFPVDLALYICFEKSRPWTKSALVPLLLFYYCQSATVLDITIILALLACLAGDILLLRPHIPRRFLWGLCCFLIGHLFYAASFFISAGYLKSASPWLYLLILPYGLYAWLLFRKIYAHIGSLKLEVLAYCVGITAMSFFALSRVTLWSGLAFWLPFAGSLLFILSDSVLAVNHFGRPVKHYCPKVIVPYAMALMLIVVGVSF